MAIITISREMGANAFPISQLAAEALGYRLIDGQSVRDAAPLYGLTPDDIDQADEKPPAFIETLDRKLLLTLHQIELIVLDFAREGNIVIYGRAGRDVLLNQENVFRVRIIAPFEQRVERLAEEEWLDPDVAYTMVRRSDHQRAGFMRYYFDCDWSDPLSYDMVINTSRISEEKAAGMIVEGVKDPAFSGHDVAAAQALETMILRKKIQIAYLSDQQAEGMPFSVQVQDRDLILNGTVSDNKHRTLIHRIAADIGSGYRVDNQIRVGARRSLQL